ncbi:MAG: OFA family MFS transporter, partial [Planctomycetes bacterium]|nr:OFA family MFS transporter [Planctomycetota bacterium]
MAETVKNRGWSVTFAGTGINLALGVLYSWSVIKKAIPAEWGWTDSEKALPYSVACLVFAFVMVPAGRMQDKIGPRWVATAGGILTGLGCIVASFATSVLWYVIGFGVLAGAGIGLGYASATPPAVKWFPARMTGLIAGLVVAGFGLASVYISPLANYLAGNDYTGKPRAELAQLMDAEKTAAGELKAARDTTPGAPALAAAQAKQAETAAALLAAKEGSISRTMLILGIGFLILVTLLAQILRAPPQGYKPEQAVAAPGAAPAAAAAINVPPSAMLKTPLFYLLWIMYTFSAGAGLMIIASLATIAKDGGIAAGFVLVALLAIGNASGRIIAGMLSDRIGRLWTMFLIFVFQAVLMLVLRAGLSDFSAFVVVSMLMGFNYGACLSVFPSATKDYFGLKNFGVNYGFVFTAWGVGGYLFSQVAGWLYDKAFDPATNMGSYANAYLVAAAALFAAAALTFVTRAYERKFNAAQGAGA